MLFIAIRILLWVMLAGLPLAWYAIAEVPYPEPVRGLAYALAIAAVVIGSAVRIPLRPGQDGTLFPVRAAAGLFSIAIPAFAALLLWAMPYLEPRTSKLLALAGATVFAVSALAFATLLGVIRSTPKP
jgi:hypothetical protein